MRRSIIAVLGLSLAFAATAAAEPEPAYTINLPVTAADLQNDQTVHALYGRVADAAQTICARLVREDFSEMLTLSSCRHDTIRRAIREADIPALSRHYAALRSGWTPADTTAIAAR
jgi:UrcA family protein